jgi:hypothetical protein
MFMLRSKFRLNKTIITITTSKDEANDSSALNFTATSSIGFISTHFLLNLGFHNPPPPLTPSIEASIAIVGIAFF